MKWEPILSNDSNYYYVCQDRRDIVAIVIDMFSDEFSRLETRYITLILIFPCFRIKCIFIGDRRNKNNFCIESYFMHFIPMFSCLIAVQQNLSRTLSKCTFQDHDNVSQEVSIYCISRFTVLDIKKGYVINLQCFAMLSPRIDTIILYIIR